MDYTKNYQLPQWEKADRIVMEDFNCQAAKLEAALVSHDTALAQKADKTTTSSLQTQVNKKANTTALNSAVSGLQNQLDGKIVFGTYQGDNQNTRFISLGFTPQAVFVIPNHAELVNTGQRKGGLALEGNPCQNSGRKVVEIVEGGFNVFFSGTSYSSDVVANSNSYTYYYFAVR